MKGNLMWHRDDVIAAPVVVSISRCVSWRLLLPSHHAAAFFSVQQVQLDNRFELTAEPRFGLVNFRLRGVPRQANAQLLQRLNDSGDIFLTQTELGGEFSIRMAICGAHTKMKHVQEGWRIIQATASAVLSEASQQPAAAKSR